jgi:hypothetical protein
VLAEYPVQIDDLSRFVEVRQFRNIHYYVYLRSSTIQRWGARIARDGSYYTLTSVLWKAASKGGTVANPIGSKALPGQKHTFYFDRVEDAEAAAVEFLNRLQTDRGVNL